MAKTYYTTGAKDISGQPQRRSAITVWVDARLQCLPGYGADLPYIADLAFTKNEGSTLRVLQDILDITARKFAMTQLGINELDILLSVVFPRVLRMIRPSIQIPLDAQILILPSPLPEFLTLAVKLIAYSH